MIKHHYVTSDIATIKPQLRRSVRHLNFLSSSGKKLTKISSRFTKINLESALKFCKLLLTTYIKNLVDAASKKTFGYIYAAGAVLCNRSDIRGSLSLHPRQFFFFTFKDYHK